MRLVSLWTPQLNAVLGSLVMAAGAWLAWDALPGIGMIIGLTVVATILLWRVRTISRVWAWTTLMLGVESFAWPLVTMVQIRMQTTEPSDEQMGTILSAVLMGVFSAVFWLAFSYGLFRLAWGDEKDFGNRASRGEAETNAPGAPSRPRKKG